MGLWILAALLITGLAQGQPYIDPDTHAMRVFDTPAMPMWVAHEWAQLTEVSSTDAYNTGGIYAHHTVQLIVVGATDVDYKVEGSLDGTNWFTIDDGNDVTTGVYEEHATMPLVYIRVSIPAEHGSDNTIDASYIGVR